MADSPDRPDSADGSDAFTVEEAGRRAVGGAALMIARGGLILVLGLGANVALARILAPRDFGLVALGTVLLLFGSFLVEGGLAAGLIRRPEPPTRRELEAVTGVQLALTATLMLAALLVAIPVGRDGLVVAVMVAALPIAMLKIPAIVLLERRLEYRVIATTDVVEAVAFYAWALATVALGAGVWGFATAAIARALAGSITTLRLGPIGLVRPRWAWREIRPLIGFGAKLQGAVVVGLLRDQALNVGIALIAGVATLGVWNLAWRVLQIPFMAFGTLTRIGLPAMARLVEAGEDPRPVIERGGAAAAVVAGALMVAVVGAAPALPVVVGPGWGDVPLVLLLAGLTLVAALPIQLSGVSYLYAAGAAGTVLTAIAIGAVVWLGVALPLVSVLGAPAAAVGWAAGASVHLGLLTRAASTRSGAALARTVWLPIAIGIVATTCGWLVAEAAGATLAAGALGVAAGEALLFVALLALRRPALRDTRRLLAMALRTFRVGRLRRAPESSAPA